MKSPVPFIKPKSYYTSPIKQSVTRDEIIPQRDSIKEATVEKEILIVENIQYEELELVKPKKTKQKPTELES